ncbi:MAG: dihydroorotate dehydrogenase electron transfer subunit [candidate division WOR-3 bacterium]
MELQRSKVIDKILFREDGYFLLKVENCFGTKISPGQFFEIRVRNDIEPFLSRPFSVFFSDNQSIWFLVKVVGKGTLILSEVEKGDFLSLIGPLGNSFPDVQEPLLVAGGSGIAPLYFYAARFGIDTLLWGLKSTPSQGFMKIFEGVNVQIVTEDGSSGLKGLVTDFVDEGHFRTVLACGPAGMLRALKGKVNPDICYVSIESVMACGLGLCFGCAVKKSDGSGYYRVCKDGPVFRLKDIEL